MHDHPHHTHHEHDHHHHHQHTEAHGVGHNHTHGPADHLHSHMKGHSAKDLADELQVLARSFVEGFRQADDKTSYLRLAGIPFERSGEDGLAMKLVDASITSNWQIGTASPAFGSLELVYMPFPGELVAHRETMVFTYVSLSSRADVDLLTLLAERSDLSADTR